jgi:hypothetical protein
VKLIVFPADTDRTLHLRIGSLDTSTSLPAKATEHTFRARKLPTGPQKVEAWIEGSGKRVGVRFVELSRQ